MADFNLTTVEFSQVWWLDALDAVIVEPVGGATCVGRGGSTLVIDFIIVSRSLAGKVVRVEANWAVPFGTRRFGHRNWF